MGKNEKKSKGSAIMSLVSTVPQLNNTCIMSVGESELFSEFCFPCSDKNPSLFFFIKGVFFFSFKSMVLSGKCPRAVREGRKLQKTSVMRTRSPSFYKNIVWLCACVFEVGVEKREGGVQRTLSSANSQHTQDRGKLQEGPKKTWKVRYKLRSNLKIYLRPLQLKPARK